MHNYATKTLSSNNVCTSQYHISKGNSSTWKVKWEDEQKLNTEKNCLKTCRKYI